MERLKDLEKMVTFIENRDNYYAGFRHVMQFCSMAKEKNSMLWNDGVIGDLEKLRFSRRIDIAKQNAIEIHRTWTIDVLKNSRSNHTIESIVHTIYNDVF